MSGVLLKKESDGIKVYIAIPTTDTTHISTNPKVVYVKVSPDQCLKNVVDAL